MAFEFQRVPLQMTIVGVQNDNVLIPIRRASGLLPLSALGNRTAEEMLEDFAGEEGAELRTVRVAAWGGCFVGLWLLGGAMCPFRVGSGREDEV